MPLRVPEGCLGGGEFFGCVNKSGESFHLSAIRGEKEPGARECLARNPAGDQGSREPLLPYSEGFVYSRASAGQSGGEREKVGGVWWRFLEGPAKSYPAPGDLLET